jgi:CheY-like chemotaxis protein
LINEILDLALIESGKLTITQETIELSETLRDCHFMVLPQAEALNIAVSFPDDVNLCYVDGDRIRIKQIMINLLSNAIKYNRQNGTVKVSCETTSQSRMKISVTDTGPGLAPDLIEQLFQPFNRLGQETSDTEGTGIGLVVTKQLVQLMGGTIGVTSEVGVGCTFWFELPLSKASMTAGIDASEIPPTMSQPTHRSNITQRTILYVEDNSANQNLVEQLIDRRSDLKLLIATTGRSGVKIAQEHLPDLIVMDINLPDISGLEALKLLRARAETASIPIIALSANAAPHDIEKGLNAGFLRYVTKPIILNEFMDALDVVLDKSGKFSCS